MLPKNRRAAVAVVLLAAAIAAIAAFAGSARAGTGASRTAVVKTVAAAATPAATCQGRSGGVSSCSISQEILMPLKINVWTDASPEQGQQATVSWSLSCTGNGGATNTSGHTTGTVPFRTRVKVPQSGGADCMFSSSISLSGGGIVNAGLYPTLGNQVMISLPTGDTAPGAPLAYYKCMTDKYNSGKQGAQVVLGGCGSIYANTWYYDGTHFYHGGLCLTDPYNGGSGTRLILSRCNGSADQAWTYRPQRGTDYDEIVLHARGGHLCVDDPRRAQANGTRLAIFTCGGGPTQGWTISGH